MTTAGYPRGPSEGPGMEGTSEGEILRHRVSGEKAMLAHFPSPPPAGCHGFGDARPALTPVLFSGHRGSLVLLSK